MGSLFAEPYRVAHATRVISDQLDPDTGNPVIVSYPPRIRKAQAFSQIGRMRGSSKGIFDVESLKKIDTEIHMAVSDPEVYSSGDSVLLFPEIDEDGDYVAGSGYAFVVDGLAVNSKLSPWPAFMKALGGIVRLRRVT